MGLFSSGRGFRRHKRLTEPVYDTPTCIREMLDIYAVHKEGIFEIEAPSKGKRRLFDRCYEFSDINYAEQDMPRQNDICRTWAKDFLNSMNVDFKIVLVNEPVDPEAVREELTVSNQDSDYPELAANNNDLIKDSLNRSSPELRKRRFLVITARAVSWEEAAAKLNTIDHTIVPVFESLGSSLIPMDACERLRTIRSFFYGGTDKGSMFSWEDIEQKHRDWRNDILPHRFVQHETWMEFDEELMSVAFIESLPTTMDEEQTVHELMDLPFASSLTLDTAYVPASDLKGRLDLIQQTNDMAINNESEANARAGNFTGLISLRKRRTKQAIEEAIDRVDENSENGFFVGMLLTIRGKTREELAANIEVVRARCRSLEMTLRPYYHMQLPALNTAFPIGARRVDCMRILLTTAFVAFQPFYAYDLIQPKG